MDNIQDTIDAVIKQDREGYLRALMATVVDYIILRIQKGVGYITEISSGGEFTAKDIWEAMPEEYKERSVPVSFKDAEYILTWDICDYITDVAENERMRRIRK